MKIDQKQSKLPNFFSIMIIFIVYVVIIELINPAFLSVKNITNVLRASGFTVVPAIGMTLIMITGNLDVSIGATAAFGGVVTSIILMTGIPIPIAIAAGLLVGILIGLCNGIIITFFDVPSIIVTIGMYYLVRGLVHIVTKSSIIYPLPQTFQRIEQQDLFGIPKIVIVSILLVLFFQFLLKKTTFGNQLFAAGSNTRASFFVGVKIKTLKVICFMLSGLLSALYGIFITSRIGSAQTNAGIGLEFQVIAAVIIGGTSPYGGYGSIIGTVLGVVFMSVIYNSMTLIKIPLYWQSAILGILIIVMVVFDKTRSFKHKKEYIHEEKIR